VLEDQSIRKQLSLFFARKISLDTIFAELLLAGQSYLLLIRA
jgi:hypothetical protein